MADSRDDLFSPVDIGEIALRNRMVMAPMTRSRASIDGVPSKQAGTYYAQRASAGLIIAEGTQPSFAGQGYPRTPGVHTADQIARWSEITRAVHAAGGAIVLQIMHAGRIAHRLNRMIDTPPVAPSAIAAQGQIRTDSARLQDFPVPRALPIGEIPGVLDEYRQAAAQAIRAGFDGVELHGTTGYLPMQFLTPNSNRRTDRYGGSTQNRVRFVVEALEAMVDGVGSPGRVGLRISPGFSFNDMKDDDPVATYTWLLRAIDAMGLAYLHINRAADVPLFATSFLAFEMFRPLFKGTMIAAGCLDRENGTELVRQGLADAVAYGRPFLANPDLPARFRGDAPLNLPDPSTFFTPGPKGYLDYPTMESA
jgi:N-ethylmaleimide reductase